MKGIEKSILALMAVFFFAHLPVQAEVVFLENSPIGQKLNLPICQWEDKSVPQKGIIVAVHGLTFYASAYDDLARYLAKEGYAFYATDIRGFGRWKSESAKFQSDSGVHFTQSEDDLINLITTLKKENPDKEIFCMGESLGANYALWVASVHPELIDGVIVDSVCVTRYLHPCWRWIPDSVKGFMHPKSPMNLEPYINPYLSEDKALTQDCLRDPKICRGLSPVDLVKTTITNKRTLKQVQDIPADMPILIIAGEKDQVFKTASIPKFIPRMGSKQVTFKTLKDKGHLLLEHRPVQPWITNLIDPWLAEQTDNKKAIVRANTDEHTSAKD